MPDERQVERVFLGCQGPAIHAAADWLVQAFEDEGASVLGEALVIVPGAQAQRRLTELLAQRSAGRALLPPTIVTLGRMADRLLPQGDRAIADGLMSMLAWSQVLREAEDGLITEVLPSPPRRDDWPGWWAVAGQVQRAADELGAQLMRVQDVAPRLEGHRDLPRWSALAELADRYERRLAEQGRVDRHAARIDAVHAQYCSWPGPVVLIATADLQPVHERVLGCLDAKVYALIAADASEQLGFNAYGGLIESYWLERPIPIDEAQIAFVDRPADQAYELLRAIEGWSTQGDVSADQITIGLGDETMSGEVARTLELAGLPVRVARGQAMSGSRPVQLLRALAGFADGLRFDALAALLRHPDAEQQIAEQTGEPTRPWLTLLDQYATDHLAVRPTSGWLGEGAQAESMSAVYQAACSLLPESPSALRPLAEWAQPMGGALSAVYGKRRLQRYAVFDRPIVAALEAIGAVLGRLTELQPASQPHCTYAQAVALVLDQVSGQSLADPGGEPAIELVGFLELLLDDAPHLAIAGMNEGYVPAPAIHSPLLSEGLRQTLGLPGDARRLARDGYALSAMLAWRSDAKLIAGRRSRAGDPLMPSRLLLKADDTALAHRVVRFVKSAEVPTAPRPSLLKAGASDRFLIPRPVLPIEPIRQLRVTAFRDYLACPYRFYLKHVLGLSVIDDRARELSPGDFGSLAHRVLRSLATSDMLAIDDASQVRERLSQSLDHAFSKAYGNDPPTAARIQAEQLRYRLDAFAPRHAELVAQGWRIAHAEKECTFELKIKGQPFLIKGTIDRIDHHPEHGYRLIDYKTSETLTPPDKAHRKRVDGVLNWVDLQLPLYLDISQDLRTAGPTEVGYIHLPKKAADAGYEAAPWDAADLEQAAQTRDAVIEGILGQVYWPPKQENTYDGLGSICGDEVPDREALIRASSVSHDGGAA